MQLGGGSGVNVKVPDCRNWRPQSAHHRCLDDCGVGDRDNPALITMPALKQSCHAGVHGHERLAAVAVEGRVAAQEFLEELVESFTEPLQLLLIAVAVLSAVFGELRDAIAIAVIVVLVAGTETLTETRSARAIAALAQLSAPTSRVVHDGHVEEVAGDRIVCGDVVALEPASVAGAAITGCSAAEPVLNARG